MQTVELCDFAISPPALVAILRFNKIGIRKLLETARPVESRRKLVGDRLMMDKTVTVRGMDGLLVELLGLERTAFDPRNLCAYQGGAVLKVLRAILRPYHLLPLVSDQSLEVALPRVVQCGVQRPSPRERAVKVVLRHFEEGRQLPEQPFCIE